MVKLSRGTPWLQFQQRKVDHLRNANLVALLLLALLPLPAQGLVLARWGCEERGGVGVAVVDGRPAARATSGATGSSESTCEPAWAEWE